MTPLQSSLLLVGSGVVLLMSSMERPRRRAPAPPRHVRRLLCEAGLAWPPGVLGALSASAALVGAAVAKLLTGLTGAAALAAAACLPLPLCGVARLARARRRRVADAWPDAIDAVLAAVRSGDSLPSAVAAAARSGPEPLRGVLGVAAERGRASGDFAGAVRALAAELTDPVSHQVAGALALAHEVGGRELGQVLRDLSSFVREEGALRRELEARQSWTVNAARVAATGPWLVLLLLARHGETRDAFAAPAGTVVLIGGTVATVVGYRLMLALGRLPAVAGDRL